MIGYCGRCKVNFRNSMEWRCPLCDSDKQINEARQGARFVVEV